MLNILRLHLHPAQVQTFITNSCFICPKNGDNIKISILDTILNDDQQHATIFAYLFVPNQLYVFRALSSSIIGST